MTSLKSDQSKLIKLLIFFWKKIKLLIHWKEKYWWLLAGAGLVWEKNDAANRVNKEQLPVAAGYIILEPRLTPDMHIVGGTLNRAAMYNIHV